MWDTVSFRGEIEGVHNTVLLKLQLNVEQSRLAI